MITECHTELLFFVFFSSRGRHTRYWHDWSSDVCSSDLADQPRPLREAAVRGLHQQPRPAGAQPFQHRFAPANRLATAPCEADEIADAAGQAVLDPRAKVRGHMHGATGRPGEGAALDGAF